MTHHNEACIGDPVHQHHTHDIEDALVESVEAAECECGSFHAADVIAELHRRGWKIVEAAT